MNINQNKTKKKKDGGYGGWRFLWRFGGVFDDLFTNVLAYYYMEVGGDRKNGGPFC